jgi:hypothetical protein
MRTEDLIELLAADRAPPGPKPPVMVALAVAAGAAAAAVLLPLVGIKPDIAAAIFDPRFIAKCFVVLLLSASAVGFALHLSRPEAKTGRWPLALAAAPLLLIALAILELTMVPSSDWMVRLLGVHWYVCLVLILAFAIVPLVALLIALRRSAPADARLAGAAAGVAAGGIATVLYVAHCPDDSPLFVAVWYTLAIGMVTLAGFLAGPRLLRW